MVASARVGRWGVLRIHSTPKPLYFSFLQTKMERSLPTDAVQRIKAREKQGFHLDAGQYVGKLVLVHFCSQVELPRK